VDGPWLSVDDRWGPMLGHVGGTAGKDDNVATRRRRPWFVHRLRTDQRGSGPIGRGRRPRSDPPRQGPNQPTGIVKANCGLDGRPMHPTAELRASYPTHRRFGQEHDAKN